MKPYRRDLKVIARSLRRNMTDAEQKLWQRLKSRQLKGAQFYRQKPLLDYIVDFYCPQAKLVIEVDGAQHMDEVNAINDLLRDGRLSSIGLKVLRFNNVQVLRETEAVLATIEMAVISASEGLKA